MSAPPSAKNPSPARRFLAIDLGAESGRGMLGALAGGRLELEEVHRFPNQPVKLLDTLVWDLPRLFFEVKTALSKATERCREEKSSLDGVSVDTWGVDYGLLSKAGDLLGNPVHYRDPRTQGIMERVFRTAPRQAIFEETGIQFLQLNTLFQLAAEKERHPDRLEQAGRLLLMPDLFHYFLTGRAVSEETIASTSQLWNPRRRAWSQALLGALEIPPDLMPEVVPPGTVIGRLRHDLAAELGLEKPPAVIAGACHDTAAAVAAVPALPEEGGEEAWGYISSGTWSLMGVELQAPLINPQVLEENFTNEVGAGGTIRFLRNLMGLWLVQECRRHWEKTTGRPLDYEALTALAEKAPALRSLVVPDSAVFFPPGDMPGRIRDFCRSSGQPVPSDEGAIVRCALESLALGYRSTGGKIARLIGRPLGRLLIVGGGSRNRLLNQLTADALGIEVIAGPAEATAMGNALLQAVAIGNLDSLPAVRRTVRDSVETETFKPRPAFKPAWDTALKKFQELAKA